MRRASVLHLPARSFARPLVRILMLLTLGVAPETRADSQRFLSTSEPLGVTNQSPFAVGRLLPAQRSTVIKKGLTAALSTSISSHFVERASGAESLLIDGESHRVDLDLRWGVSPRWDVSMRVPYIRQTSGFLDPVINDWHQVFGLPDGGREAAVNDRLRYAYANSDGALLIDQSSRGVGDIELASQYLIHSDRSLNVALMAGVEVPTGDVRDLAGNDSAEGLLGFRFSGAHGSDLPLIWHGQVGVSATRDRGDRALSQRSSIVFGGLAVDWRWHHDWSLILQVDAHQATADSQINALADPAVIGSIALGFKPSRQWFLEAGFSEDLQVAASPDVTFFARVRYRPGN